MCLLGGTMSGSATSEVLLELTEVRKEFGAAGGMLGRLLGRAPRFRALDDVSLTLHRREVVGLVGESGCGKSTLAQVAIRLLDVDAGSVAYKGNNVTRATGAALRPFRTGVQMVFQDTGSSLNPRKTVARHLAEALAVAGLARDRRQARAEELLRMVGLEPAILLRLPHQLSGGQRQRLAIARSLAMDPEVLIADEPVASLDVSLQAQIVNLLDRLRRDLGLSLLFISHDLALVARISTRVAVMFAGTIVEEGAPEHVLAAPAHPYTRALLAAIPQGIDGRARRRGQAEPEDQAVPDIGCRFANRCPLAAALCRAEAPPPVRVSASHVTRCHFAGSLVAHPGIAVPAEA